MPRFKKTTETVEPETAEKVTAQPPVQDATRELVNALVEAIKLTKPAEKKNPFNKTSKNPWQPKDGSPKLKLRRKHYQHSLPIDPDLCSNERIALLNKLKPGNYMDGWVKVIQRKDRGIDIDYPVKTVSQRLRLVNNFGIRSFDELLQRCIDEAAKPKQEQQVEDVDE